MIAQAEYRRRKSWWAFPVCYGSFRSVSSDGTSFLQDYARPIVALLEAHFPETLAKAFLYPVGGAFRLGWSVAKMIFDE